MVKTEKMGEITVLVYNSFSAGTGDNGRPIIEKNYRYRKPNDDVCGRSRLTRKSPERKSERMLYASAAKRELVKTWLCGPYY